MAKPIFDVQPSALRDEKVVRVQMKNGGQYPAPACDLDAPGLRALAITQSRVVTDGGVKLGPLLARQPVARRISQPIPHLFQRWEVAHHLARFTHVATLPLGR